MKPTVVAGDRRDDDHPHGGPAGPGRDLGDRGGGGRPATALRRVGAAIGPDLRAALPGWIAGRVLVAVAALVADFAIGRWRREVGPPPMRYGLFAWDGNFYRGIAEQGYLAIDQEAIRFFPLYPQLGVNGAGLLVLAWVAALAAGAVVHRLTLDITGDTAVARRAAFLVGVAPPSFVLVWAYSESLFMTLAAAALLAMLRRRWWLAGGLGALAALCRPTGALLALAAGVEGLRGWRAASRTERLARLVAVGAPLVATAGWYAWVGANYGDVGVGLDEQERLRHGFVDPLTSLGRSAEQLFTGGFAGHHLPFALGLVALVVLAARRLPAGLSVFAGATVVAALSAGNLDSIERYGLSAVPLVVVAATVARTRAQAVTGAVLSCVLFVVLCSYAWYGLYVP
ncbi:MAG: hypothetical protein WKF93_04575 [Acidimicrobiales bacterium]